MKTSYKTPDGNEPPLEAEENLAGICNFWLEELRSTYNRLYVKGPKEQGIIINHGFRSVQVSEKMAKAGLKPSKTSNHLRGCAVDIGCKDKLQADWHMLMLCQDKEGKTCIFPSVLLQKQVCLEVIKLVGHVDALLGALHEVLQTLGDGNRLTDNGLYGVFELGRVGGLDEETYLAWTQTFTQGTMTASTMWVEEVAIGLIDTTDLVGNLLVVVGGTTDVGTYGFVAVVIEGEYAGEIAGVANVHGIR